MKRFILGLLLTIILYSIGAVVAGFGLAAENLAVTAGLVFLGGCIMLYPVLNIGYNVVVVMTIRSRAKEAQRMRNTVNKVFGDLQAYAKSNQPTDNVSELLRRARRDNDDHDLH